jgi:glycosyltransferase involved in cell wall biosynthesis
MPDKIRILYYYPYLEFDTGSPRALVQFIDSLDRRLFTPIYCAPGPGPLTEAMAMRGVEIVPLDEELVSIGAPIAAIRTIHRQAGLLNSWKIDLVHANCFPWNSDVILAARVARIPVVLHVQNPLDVAFQNLARFAARKVLFCSGAVMRNCRHFHRVAAKSEVLYNLVDLDAWSRGTAIRESLELSDDDIVIGTVAQIVHRKGIDILLEAARELLRERRDIVFVIAGPQMKQEEEFGRRMLAIAEEPEFGGRVRFLGSRDDIPDVMTSMDLFVLPSRAEPLGIVVLEAMAAGVPVIASKVGGIPEMLNSPEVGTLVDPLTPGAFANAVREVLCRPDRGKSMGQRARASLPGKFDTSSGGQRLKKIYLELLGRTETLTPQPARNRQPGIDPAGSRPDVPAGG